MTTLFSMSCALGGLIDTTTRLMRLPTNSLSPSGRLRRSRLNVLLDDMQHSLIDIESEISEYDEEVSSYREYYDIISNYRQSLESILTA